MTRLDLDARLEALVSAQQLMRPYVPDPVDARIDSIVARAGHRRGLGLESTVVALAGSTGSGKSSLFNAIAGLNLAETGVRRPTTAETLACVWGQAQTDPLLEWLGIPQRRRVSHASPLNQGPEPLDGLVLLDLPDHDSMVLGHRAEVDRLVGLVDLFVWVTDPVKYADALLHEEYLSRLDRHGSVVLVAFNQVDRLREGDRDACVTDLHRLLDRDGLAQVDVLGLSAVTGEGIDDLSARLREVVQARTAALDRLAADVAVAADQLATAVGAGARDAGAEPPQLDDLTDQLAEALAIGGVAHRRGAQQRHAAAGALRWPMSRGSVESDEAAGLALEDVTSPAATDAVVAEYVAASSAALPPVWRDDLCARLDGERAGLVRHWTHEIDAAEAIEIDEPAWWVRHRQAQWASVAAMAAGVVALLGMAVLSTAGTAMPTGAWLAASVLLVVGVVAAVALTRRVRDVPQDWADRVEDEVRDRLRALVRDEAAATLVRPAGAARTDYRAALRALALARARG